jgi:hypothetical protein
MPVIAQDNTEKAHASMSQVELEHVTPVTERSKNVSVSDRAATAAGV